MKSQLLVLVVFAAIALAIVAYAQAPGPMERPPMMMGPPIPPVMVHEGGYLFILRGDQLLKVQAATMAVEKNVGLPRPEPTRPPTPPPGD